MVKTIIDYPSHIPISSVILEDIVTVNGSLLVKRGTVVTEELKNHIKNYKGKVKYSIEIQDDDKDDNTNVIKQELKEKAKKEDDHLFKLSNDIKEQTLKGVEYIYNKDASAGDMIDIAHDISTSVMKLVSESNEINISLEMLKVSDEYTFKHCVDVGTMGMLVAKKMGLNVIKQNECILAGILHDVGKTEVPLEIINKPGKLTKEEYDVIKKHPIYGYKKFAGSNTISENVKLGILQHHENIDGSGYPLQLNSSKISDIGKILAVVDVYDALVTKRSYKEGYSHSDALEMLMAMINKFDTKMLTAFLHCVVIYPVGSEVILNGIRKCIVLKNNPNYPLRPIIGDILTGEEIDLTLLQHLSDNIIPC